MSLGQNLSDPNSNGAPGCLNFGHPLEAFYRVGGGEDYSASWEPGDFVWDFTDAEINMIVHTGKGPDKTLFPDSANRTINVQSIFGGIERDESGMVVGAKALLFTYLLEQAAEGTPMVRTHAATPSSGLAC